jgi:hypothetical protein
MGLSASKMSFIDEASSLTLTTDATLNRKCALPYATTSIEDRLIAITRDQTSPRQFEVTSMIC